MTETMKKRVRVRACPHGVAKIGWGWANHRKVCAILVANGDLKPRHRAFLDKTPIRLTGRPIVQRRAP